MSLVMCVCRRPLERGIHSSDPTEQQRVRVLERGWGLEYLRGEGGGLEYLGGVRVSG